MENFSNLETMDQIKQKLLTLDYEDLMILLATYQCTVGELPGKIAKAKGLKDSLIAAGKKKEETDFHQVQLCRLIYSQNNHLETLISSAKVIVGVLNDISNAINRIADG
jgi:hypothetical protein